LEYNQTRKAREKTEGLVETRNETLLEYQKQTIWDAIRCNLDEIKVRDEGQ